MKRDSSTNQPVRMKDIARDLGVSVVTVSKVLRDHSDISTATKRRVRKRIRELNYHPNLIARSLASKHTFTIGLVVPDLTHTFFGGIANIRGPQVGNGGARLNGYRKALARYGLKMPAGYVVGDKFTVFTGGTDEMRQLLRLDPRPDGVFCFNDSLAVGAMKAVLEAGLRVPEDVALVGASNTRLSDFLRVPLTTIDQSSELNWQLAGDLILDLIQSKRRRRPRTVLVGPRLIG